MKHLTDEPIDHSMYWAVAWVVGMPLLCGIDVLMSDPVMLLLVTALTLGGLPISVMLRRRGVDHTALNRVVSVLAVVLGAAIVLPTAMATPNAFSADRWMNSDARLAIGWLLRFIAWVVAWRSLTLVADLDLLLCIGFGLSQFILLAIVEADVVVFVSLLPFAAASLFLLMRFRRAQLRQRAGEVLGRPETSDWHQDTRMLVRLGGTVGVLSIVLSLGLSNVVLPASVVQGIGAKWATRLSQWLQQYETLRLPEGAETAMDVGDSTGSRSEAMVFKVRGPRGMLWRGKSYATYDGRRFRSTGEKALKYLDRGDGLYQLEPDYNKGTIGLEKYTFVRAAELGTQLYLVASPYFVQLPAQRLMVDASRSGSAVPPLPADAVYSVWAPPSNQPLPLEPHISPEDRVRYLQLPVGFPQRITQKAREITAGARDQEEKIRLIVDWLGKNFTYTDRPEPIPRNTDAVDYFLFNMRHGWCRHFASACAVMARSVAVPARVVTGYATGDPDTEPNAYLVRAKHAHAWVECYIQGKGWVEYDPTMMAVEELTGLALVMEQARNRWRNTLSALTPAGERGVVALLVGLVLGTVALLWRRRQRRRAATQGAQRSRAHDRRAERLALAFARTAARAGLRRGSDETDLALARRLTTARPSAADHIAEAAETIARGRFSRPLLTADEVLRVRWLLAAIARSRPPQPPRGAAGR